MQKQAPTAGQLAVIVVFALSCFLILTYLWTSFGGPTPISAKGYRFQADFEEATQLADNADVRISGVTVGHVKKSEQVETSTRVEIELDDEYAPIPKDTRATLRQKTLLGETYIELTPGTEESGDLPEDALLPATQIRPTVELDEILRALDKPTRDDLQRFLKGTARAFAGRGEDVNAAARQPVAVRRGRRRPRARAGFSQHRAVRRMISDSGQVFESLGRRQGQLSGLVRSLDVLLGATARRNAELAETVRILPTTLRELRPTLAEVETVSREARPLVRDLRPAARALEPTLADALPLAPELRGLFRRRRSRDHRLRGRASRGDEDGRGHASALPAARPRPPGGRARRGLPQPLREGDRGGDGGTSPPPRRASERQGAGTEPIHYLRALVPFTYEGLVAADERFGTNRHNPYLLPGALEKLGTQLEAYDCRNAENSSPPGAQAPPCVVAPNLEFQGRSTRFPQLRKAR